MNQIYSEAETVLVFLGLGDERSDAAMIHLRDEFDSRSTPSEDQRGFPSMEDIAAMQVLCSREYWERTWILQEVLVATRLELHYGTQSIPWAAFEYMARKFRREAYMQEYRPASKRKIVNVSRGPAIRLVNHRSGHSQSSRDSDLVSLLERYRLSQCTDRRDSVYALLGLASDKPMQRGLVPDYGKHVVALYTEVLHYCKVDPSKTLWFAFLLRMMLKIRQTDVFSYERQQNDPNPSLIEVKAACLGSISYVFPTLDILREDHRPFHSYLDDSDCESDNDIEDDDFTSETVGYSKHAQFVYPERGHVSIIPTDDLIQEKADQEVLLNNISYLPGNFAHSSTKRHADFEHIEHPWPMTIPRTDSDLHTRQQDRAQRASTKLLGLRERAQRKTQPNLIEATGKGFQRRAGYACDHAKAGDMICQFLGSEVGLVLRHQHPFYRIVGRVDMMEQNLPDRWEEMAVESDSFSPVMLKSEEFDVASYVTLRVTALDLLRFARHDFASFAVLDWADCTSWLDSSWSGWLTNAGAVFASVRRYLGV